MAPSLFLFVFVLLLSKTNSETWYGLEPYATKPMISMFAGIHEEKLYLVGGPENSVTTINIKNIYMNDYDGILYQPDLNVIDGEWTTKEYWYTFNYGLFCTRACSTQIGERLYIVAPFKNMSGSITQTTTLFVYDLDEYRFLSIFGYDRGIPRDVEGACIVNNNTHIFIIGGGAYSDKTSVYSTINDAWVEMNSTLNIGRINFGCSFDANKSNIYVFAGDITDTISTSTIEQYDIATDKWTLVTSYNTVSPTSTPTIKPTEGINSTTTTTTTSATNAELVTLTFKRSKHQCILDVDKNEIYIFGGGGCSEVDNICSNYRNLVEIFEITTSSIRADDVLLLSAISDSYGALFWSYSAKQDSKQAGSWFDGIFVIGGNTENKNATNMVQYRITDYNIINIQHIIWTPDHITYVLFIISGLCILVIIIGFIFKMITRYTDTRLLSVFCWFLYLMDVIFDCAFNQHLWSRSKFTLAAVSLFFILLRLIYSIGWQLNIALKQWSNDIAIRQRVKEYLSLYMAPVWAIYVCAFVSGSAHGLIHLLNSNLFGLSVFKMGLTTRHLMEYNVNRLASGLICGNIPQLIIQILYILEWGTNPAQESKVFYAIVTTFVSLCFGLGDIWNYRHSQLPLRKLMLEQDFTKPYFLIFTSKEIFERGYKLVHKSDALVDVISQMINVQPDTVEINLCQVVPEGIKISFVEYSGTKNALDISRELSNCIEGGWFQTSVKTHWRLSEKPMIEIWDVQLMYEHKQLFTVDFSSLNRDYLYADNCCAKWCKYIRP